MFATHRNRTANAHLEFIKQRAIPVGPPKVESGGKAYGMDQSDGFGAVGSTSNVFSIGNQIIEPGLLAWYASQGFIGYQACAIIAQNWLVNKACTQKGRDAARNWFRVTINDGTEVDEGVISFIEKANKRFKLKKNLCEASKFNNVFGIRHILFHVESNDPKYYEKPFNPDGIKAGAYKGMSQIDPYWIAQNLSTDSVADPKSINFYEPTHWTIGDQKIHRSHFVILRGDEVADFLKPSYLYGGLSLAQRIFERVYASERTANEGPQLAMTKRLNIRKVDMAKALANPQELEAANAFLSQNRDNYGVLYAGKDEEVAQLETSLTDLDATIMTQYQLVAATANTPATKLLGTSPKGFNATGEHEIDSYHEELESIQEHDYDPIIERHLTCLMKSEVIPKFGVDFEVDIEWNPLAVESRKEKAEINELNSRTAMNYSGVGAVDNYDIRQALINDPDSGYDGMEMPEEGEELPNPNDLTPDPKPDESSGIESGEDSVGMRNGLHFVFDSSGEIISRGYTTEAKAYTRLGQLIGSNHNG